MTTSTLPPSLMCSTTEAAALMGVSVRHVRNLVARGEFPAPVRRSGDRILINREHLEAWCRGDDQDTAS